MHVSNIDKAVNVLRVVFQSFLKIFKSIIDIIVVFKG